MFSISLSPSQDSGSHCITSWFEHRNWKNYETVEEVAITEDVKERWRLRAGVNVRDWELVMSTNS